MYNKIVRNNRELLLTVVQLVANDHITIRHVFSFINILVVLNFIFSFEILPFRGLSWEGFYFIMF